MRKFYRWNMSIYVFVIIYLVRKNIYIGCMRPHQEVRNRILERKKRECCIQNWAYKLSGPAGSGCTNRYIFNFSSNRFSER